MAAYTLTQLNTELTTDPKSLGYAAFITSGDDTSLAALINSTYVGVATVFRNDVSAGEVLASLVWSEISTLSTNNWLALNAMLSPRVVDATKTTVRNFFVGLFPSGTFPTTSANLTAVAKKTAPSRAEELWGYGTIVPVSDISRSLRG